MYLAAVWESAVTRIGRAMVASQLTYAVWAPRASLPKISDSSPMTPVAWDRPPGCGASVATVMAYLWPRAGTLTILVEISVCWMKLLLVPPPRWIAPETRARAAIWVMSRTSWMMSNWKLFFFSKREAAMPMLTELSAIAGQKIGTRDL